MRFRPIFLSLSLSLSLLFFHPYFLFFSFFLAGLLFHWLHCRYFMLAHLFYEFIFSWFYLKSFYELIFSGFYFRCVCVGFSLVSIDNCNLWICVTREFQFAQIRTEVATSCNCRISRKLSHGKFQISISRSSSFAFLVRRIRSTERCSLLGSVNST